MNERILRRLISEQLTDTEWASLSPADLGLLVQESQVQGVAPLLYWRLGKTGRLESLPASMQRSLRAAYHSVRMNNEQIIREMEILTRQFDQAGIPVVVLKGACFALTIYPDIGLRPMADLDMLVPASRSSEAKQIAQACGYAEPVPEAFPGLGAFLGDEICLRKTDPPFTSLELHNNLLVNRSYTYAAPVEWFWEQTEPMRRISPVEGHEKLLMLTPSAQLLHAAAHAMLKHGGRDTSLRWYYDLDRIVCTHADRMDWDLLIPTAKIFHWSSALHKALSRAHSYFDTPIPENMLEKLASQPDRHRKLVALRQNAPTSHVQEEFQNLAAMKWYGRIVLILGLIVPSPAYMRWRYQLKSPWHIPVYYLIRWRGIVKEAFSTVFHLMRTRRQEG